MKNVDNWAFPQQQIRIAVNIEKMAELKIPLNRVIGAVQSENVNIPGGSIDMGTKKFNIKTSGDYKTVDEINNPSGFSDSYNFSNSVSRLFI